MNDWQARLDADPIPWLLEPDNPTVRYFALTELLDRPERNPEARRSRQAKPERRPTVRQRCCR